MADNRYPTRIDRNLFERMRDEILPARKESSENRVTFGGLVDEALQAYFFEPQTGYRYLQRLHMAANYFEVETIKGLLTPEVCMALVRFLVEFQPTADELHAMCNTKDSVVSPEETHPLNYLRYVALSVLLTSDRSESDNESDS